MTKRTRKTVGKTFTHEQYLEAVSKARAMANADGFDRGLEWNAILGEFTIRMLPGKPFRFGHERSCEVVSCDLLEKCQPGHGPCAYPR